MWRFPDGSFAVAAAWALAAAVACGGRARGDGSSEVPAVAAGTGGARIGTDANAGGSMPTTSGAGGSMPTSGGASAAGAGGGTAAADADSDLSNSCPPATNDRSCLATELDIHFTRDAGGPPTDVWVEPLQLPDYPQGVPADLPEVEPSKWDRSARPAGACVLRIHGLSGSCLRPGALFVGTCAAHDDPGAPHILPFGYYEGGSCQQGIAPGCPSSSAADLRNGNWWYLVARGEDTDLVVCAPQCGTSFNSTKQACLRLAGAP